MLGNGQNGVAQKEIVGTAVTPAKVRHQRVLLLGAGAVGRVFVRALLEMRREIAARLGLRLDLVGLADSKSALVAPLGALGDDQINAALAAKDARKSLADMEGAQRFTDARALVQSVAASGERLIVVDTTATDATVPALLEALAGGHAVVLANKKPLSIEQEVYDRLTRAGVTGDPLDSPIALRRVRWETTCGAALPVIVTQQRLLAGGDRIHRITGTLSGTLGYVMTGLQQGRRFSEVVREAHQLGYTEPDPRDDLGGVDIARKALILARGMGWRMELADVQVESLYPLHMAALSVAEFLAALPQLDAHFEKLVRNAADAGGVLRYAAQVVSDESGGRCTVGPAVVSAESPLGRLAGTDNLVEFHTRWYHDAPLVIQGRGAGVDVTASGVLADVVDLAIAS